MKYLGKDIHLAGKPGDKSIWTFQHMFQDGSCETIGLRFNKTYKVGESDECGNVINDWVYEAFLRSEFNYNREKTKLENDLDAREAKDGVITAQAGPMID